VLLIACGITWVLNDSFPQITDQPSFRPPAPIKPESRKKYVVLSLAVPPASAAASTVPFVQGVFHFVDALAGVGGHKLLLAGLRPETRSKLRKRRDELNAELRADALRETKEAEQEAREDAIAAKRKAEKDRIAGLSAAEQQKVYFIHPCPDRLSDLTSS
jgi:hypothetical protein